MYSKILFITIWILSISAYSQIPKEFSVQGLLTDTLLNAKPDGVYEITFRLYLESDGGSAVWESKKSVSVMNGIFSVILGESNDPALPIFDRELFFTLQIEGDNQELLPRRKLVSTPYSFRSIWADSSFISQMSNRSIKSDTSLFCTKSDTARASFKSSKSDTSVYSKSSQNADTANYVKNIILPVGSIIPYAGSGVGLPSDWMICDGRALSSSQYPVLYQAIGKAWGDGSDDNNINTNFNIPDLRGMFLRGVDDSCRVDPDAMSRQSLKPGGNNGASVGSMQMDMAKGNLLESTNFDRTSSFSSKATFVPLSEWSSRKFINAGANETRPVNVYVTYIIKVK